MAETVIAQFPHPLRTVTAVRSTLVQSSLSALREAGLFERYVVHLPTAYHSAVLQTFAPTWLPIAAAAAHYRACDLMGLGEQETLAIGKVVGRNIQQSSLSSVVRAGRTVGVSPWTVLGAVDRLWPRVMEGGGMQVLQTGPKDATVELAGVPLVEFAYFRNGFRGLLMTMGDLLTSRSFVRIVDGEWLDQRLKFRISWV